MPTYRPIVRSNAGSSFGPTTKSATTPMTSNSPQPISNMSLCPRPHPPDDRKPPSSQSGGLGLSWAAGSSARLAALGLGPLDRLDRRLLNDFRTLIGLSRGLVLCHPLLEALDALGNVAHDFGDLAAAKQQHDDQQNNDPVPNAGCAHLSGTPLQPAAALHKV